MTEKEREKKFHAYLDEMERYLDELMLDCVKIEYPQHGVIWTSLAILFKAKDGYENSDLLADTLIKIIDLKFPGRADLYKKDKLRNNP